MTCYVYFIRSGFNKKPPIKIGVAEDVEKRILELQTGNPEKLSVVCTIECKNRKEAYSLESFIHSKLRKRKIRGEWFATCMRRVNKAVESYDFAKEIDFKSYLDKEIDEELDRQILYDPY